MKRERLQEIQQRLVDLGPVDGWRGAVDSDSGLLVLHLPSSRYPAGLCLTDMEQADATDLALLEFLGDAPHAINDLLEGIQHGLMYSESKERECDRLYARIDGLSAERDALTAEVRRLTEVCDLLREAL